MISKQEILEDFWEEFPQHKEMTPTYESIRFEEEEIANWNLDWIEVIFNTVKNNLNDAETLKDLEEYIKLK